MCSPARKSRCGKINNLTYTYMSAKMLSTSISTRTLTHHQLARRKKNNKTLLKSILTDWFQGYVPSDYQRKDRID